MACRMMSFPPFAWQHEQAALVQSYLSTKTLPHALLLVGPKGLGKKAFAIGLAQIILCKKNESNACGACDYCHWFTNATHPDYIHLTPLEKKSVIGIDAIRQVKAKLCETTMSGKPFVVVIDKASQLTVESANALLKLLEEPQSAHFILLAENRSELLPTISSRTQAVTFKPVSDEKVCSYLVEKGFDSQLSFLLDGSPLLADERLSEANLSLRTNCIETFIAIVLDGASPVSASETLKSVDTLTVANEFLRFLRDIWVVQLTTGQVALLNQDKKQQLLRCAECFDAAKLALLMDKAQDFIRPINKAIAVNQHLWLDDLLIELAVQGMETR